MNVASKESLFARLGGEAAVEAAVVSFYERVLADATIAHFFDHMDVDALIRKQIAFMTMAFAGPNNYTGRDLRVAHAPLVAKGLNDAHFDAVGGHLQDTLVELGVDAALTAEVMGIVGTTRDAVLGR